MDTFRSLSAQRAIETSLHDFSCTLSFKQEQETLFSCRAHFAKYVKHAKSKSPDSRW